MSTPPPFPPRPRPPYALVFQVGVVFGSPDVTTGGMALRFYSSVRLEVRKGQAIKSNGEMVGTKVRPPVGCSMSPPARNASSEQGWKPYRLIVTSTPSMGYRMLYTARS